ncbi:MAG: hypothetical protein GY906_35235 [bacterium]|nr:hypothetical protein [bacterium]
MCGNLLALPEPGERGVVLIRPGSPLAVLHYHHLKVLDPDGRTLGARLGPAPGSGGRLHFVIEDERATYPLVIDPLLTTAVWASADSDSETETESDSEADTDTGSECRVGHTDSGTSPWVVNRTILDREE